MSSLGLTNQDCRINEARSVCRSYVSLKDTVFDNDS